MKSSHFLYISDICRTTFVSAADDQTPDSCTAVYNAKNLTSLVGGNASHGNATGSRPTTAIGRCVANSQELLHMYQRHLSNYFRFRRRRSNSQLRYRRTFQRHAVDTGANGCRRQVIDKLAWGRGNTRHAATGSRPTTSTARLCRD